MVICLERGADLHMAQLMPLPLTVSCFSKIRIGFTFLVPAHLGSPGKGLLNGCVCVCVVLPAWRIKIDIIVASFFRVRLVRGIFTYTDGQYWSFIPFDGRYLGIWGWKWH